MSNRNNNPHPWSCVKCGASGIQYGSGRPRKYCSSCAITKSKPYAKITDQEKLERRRLTQRKSYAKHSTPRIRRSNKKAYILAKKLERIECIVCHLKITINNHTAFDLDHRIPRDKTFALSRATGRSLEAIDHEFTKVDLMCKMCHVKKTEREGDHKHRPDEQYELQVQELQMSLFDEW